MRCRAKKRWMRDARCSEYREYSQAEQQSRRAFWQQPEGTGRFGRISALLALTILAICFRARALNCAQSACRRIRETKSDRLQTMRAAAGAAIVAAIVLAGCAEAP